MAAGSLLSGISGKAVSRWLTHPVSRNALALYGVQFAGYVIPLITLPYLSRVLRAEGFGLLVFAQSFALWASGAFEYGFNLSATREVAQNRGNKRVVGGVAAGVLGAKLVLVVGFGVITCVAALAVVNFRRHPEYLMWAALQALAFGFSPFWYFQGTEKLVRCVVMEFVSRTAAAALVFPVVQTSQDGWKAMALLAGAGCVTTLSLTVWMYQEIGFQRPNWKGSMRALKVGWHMFLFRGAYNVYGSANAFILGLFVPSVRVGYFGGGEKIAKALQGLAVPFTQALYPHMSRLISKDALRASQLARRTVVLAGLGGILLAGAVFLFAPLAVSLILGPAYGPSVKVLYIFGAMLPVYVVNTALIMYWMLPRGMEGVVSGVTFGAIAANLLGAALLTRNFAEVGMAFAVLAAETIKLMALVTILVGRARASANAAEEIEVQTAQVS